MNCKQISLETWQASKGEQDVLLDVRSPAEYASGHVPGSINLPLGECKPERLRDVLGQIGVNPAVKICLICQSGNRSKMAAQQLQGWSGGELLLLDCGVGAMDKSRLNVTGKGVIALDRQVRIAAGALVVIGALGSLWISPALIYLSAFVGAGLMFAGITDTCAMVKVLERMPWNKA